MEPILKKSKRRMTSDEEQDPRGPMMVWDGPRSEEDILWMSNWAEMRKAELEKEKAYSAAKAE